MTQIIPYAFGSSSLGNSQAIPLPAVVEGVASRQPLFDEIWEPPTPDQWRRAIRAIAMRTVRQVLLGGGDCGLTRGARPTLH
jgi:hypothetical protein